MNFEYLVEKIKNPLRKEGLRGNISPMGDYRGKGEEWKRYILSGDVSNDSDATNIRDQYLQFKKNFPDRAEKWLNLKAKEYESSFKRSKIGNLEKFLDYKGFQFFIDELVDENFKTNPYNQFVIKKLIDKLLIRSRGILPQKKPRLVITDRTRNRKFSGLYSKNPPAVEHDKIIYIDQYKIDDFDILLHEYAHYVADLIPTESSKLLERAYNELLDIYWKRAKKKRMTLQPDSGGDQLNNKKIESLRGRISQKLGFPEYGLINFHEFFAVLMEGWISDNPHKRLPDNAATYKFKQLVKSTLHRL